MDSRDELLAACREQHFAIDMLFAMLIAATKDSEKPFLPSQSGAPWRALLLGNAAIKNAEAEEDTHYTTDDMEAGACMWEHVLTQLRRAPESAWAGFCEAYGMAELRLKVIRHAPVLDAKYQEAVANGYGDSFDWDFVPKYMEDHVTRVLA